MIPSFLIFEFSVVRFNPRRGGAAGATDPALALAQGAQNIIAFRGFKSHDVGGWFDFGRQRQLAKRDVQYCTPREDHRAFNEILQFAYITRPVPAREGFHGFRGDGVYTLVHALRVLLSEVID